MRVLATTLSALVLLLGLVPVAQAGPADGSSCKPVIVEPMEPDVGVRPECLPGGEGQGQPCTAGVYWDVDPDEGSADASAEASCDSP